MNKIPPVSYTHLDVYKRQVYNMADSIIVGQFVGSSALAAVGACAAPVSYTHLDVYKRQCLDT